MEKLRAKILQTYYDIGKNYDLFFTNKFKFEVFISMKSYDIC